MKAIILSLILILLSLSSCTKKEKISIAKMQRNYPIDSFKNYSFKISNLNYDFDMKSRKFEISFYKFSDSIKLSKTEENKIAEFFFESFIDTIRNDNFIRDQNEPLIMPNFGDFFVIYHKGYSTSFIKLENGEYKDVDKFSGKDQNIIKFKKNLFNVLHQNKDFKRCLDTIHSLKKCDNRIFM